MLYDVFWAITGRDTLQCIFINQNPPKIKKFSYNILKENRIEGFYPTPYGVVVLGENKIGLIEENPAP